MLYSVWHEDEEGDNGKLIGVFLSREDADQVIANLSKKPGFCDYVDGFTVGRINLDTDRHWFEGFLGYEGTKEWDE